MTPAEANAAVCRAFGLDPRQVRALTLYLDRDEGPMLSVQLYQLDELGHRFMEDGNMAVLMKEFRLVEIERGVPGA